MGFSLPGFQLRVLNNFELKTEKNRKTALKNCALKTMWKIENVQLNLLHPKQGSIYAYIHSCVEVLSPFLPLILSNYEQINLLQFPLKTSFLMVLGGKEVN